MNAGPKGSTQERASPLGNQHENWWAERRSFVSGNPVVFFNAAGALEWLDFDCAVSEVVTAIALFFYSLSFSSLVAFRSSARSLPPIASGVSLTSTYLSRLFVVVKMGRVLHLPFDVDHLGHGPP